MEAGAFLEVSFLLPVLHGCFGAFVVCAAAAFGLSGCGNLIDDVIDAVVSTQAIDYTARAARAEADKALDHISELPASPYKEALQMLAEFSVSRSY